MKKVINRLLGVLLTLAVAFMPLQGIESKTGKSVETSAEHVAQEVSLLDHIVEQAANVVEAGDNKLRLAAKKELAHLMSSKDLDSKIKELIKDDVVIIQKTTDKTAEASQKAYDRLLDVIASIDAQANVVMVTQQAAKMVQNAPEGEKLGMMQLAYQKIQQATKAAQGMASRAYSGAKSVVTKPVNYVFGEEDSKAKTAFYATVGALVLASGAYGAYRYGVHEGMHVGRKKLLPPMSFLEKMFLGEARENLSFLEELLEGEKNALSSLSDAKKSLKDEKKRLKQEKYDLKSEEYRNNRKEYESNSRHYGAVVNLIDFLEKKIADKKAWLYASGEEYGKLFQQSLSK